MLVLFSLVALTIVFLLYESVTDEAHRGMSIIPEKTEDIPLYNGLKPRENDYVIKGNHWLEIYDYYLAELPSNGWELDYKQSYSDEAGSFISRWKKPGFNGELWISANFNKYNSQTEVIFDHHIPPKSTTWISTVPNKICVYNTSLASCKQIQNKEVINKIVTMINEESWDVEHWQPQEQYRMIEINTKKVEVHFI